MTTRSRPRDGDDEVEGSPGDDHMAGGPGVDELQFNLAPGGVSASLGATALQPARDPTRWPGSRTSSGTLFDDQLTGDDGPNRLDGAFGQDVITGAGGADLLLR